MSNVKSMLKHGTLVLASSGVVTTVVTSRAYAAACDPLSAQGGANCAQGNGQSNDLLTQIRVVTNTMLFAIGVVAVIMLIVGGFRYIFSGGNSTSVNAAKDTILYAVIGIVVALLAYAIVNFVLGQFSA